MNRIGVVTRSLVFGLLVLAGCGDGTVIPDMTAAPADLSGPRACGVDGIALSCSGVSGTTGCFVCDYTGGSGHCAQVCSLTETSCPTGKSCIAISAGDGGTPSRFAVEGTGCGGLGFCR